MKYKLKENKKGEFCFRSISEKVPEKDRKKFFGDMPEDRKPLSIGIRKDKVINAYCFYVSVKSDEGKEVKRDLGNDYISSIQAFSKNPEKTCRYIGKAAVSVMEKTSFIKELSKKDRAEIMPSCMDNLLDYRSGYNYNNEYQYREYIAEAFKKEFFKTFVKNTIKADKYKDMVRDRDMDRDTDMDADMEVELSALEHPELEPEEEEDLDHFTDAEEFDETEEDEEEEEEYDDDPWL